MAQFTGAFGDGGNHCVAMRDGFVAGRLNPTGEVLCGLDCALFHSAILAWGFGGKSFTTEGTVSTEFGRVKTCPVVQFRGRNRAVESATFLERLRII